MNFSGAASQLFLSGDARRFETNGFEKRIAQKRPAIRRDCRPFLHDVFFKSAGVKPPLTHGRQNGAAKLEKFTQIACGGVCWPAQAFRCAEPQNHQWPRGEFDGPLRATIPLSGEKQSFLAQTHS